MKIKVGINGFGRIGKVVFRLLQYAPDIEVVAINDPVSIATMAHLLKYDTVHGRFGKEVSFDEKTQILRANGLSIQKYSFKNPSDIPWKKHQVDIVLEASGLFRTRKELQQHIDAGASKVILSCPADDELDKTIVFGVNDYLLTPQDIIVSNASCTTNCIATALKLIDDAFGIENGFLNTVHPFTNNQRIMDAPHDDLRRARGAASNIIPTTTTAIRCVHKVLPHLAGRFDGFATRVPVFDGSISELVLDLKEITTVDAIHQLMRNASENKLKGILDYCDDPIVSSDVIGQTASAIYDAQSTKVLGGQLIQIVLWYDNEFGYSSRICDLIRKMWEK